MQRYAPIIIVYYITFLIHYTAYLLCESLSVLVYKLAMLLCILYKSCKYTSLLLLLLRFLLPPILWGLALNENSAYDTFAEKQNRKLLLLSRCRHTNRTCARAWARASPRHIALLPAEAQRMREKGGDGWAAQVIRRWCIASGVQWATTKAACSDRITQQWVSSFVHMSLQLLSNNLLKGLPER